VHTSQAGMKPEFQKIHPSADGKMKCVVTSLPRGLPMPSAHLDRTMLSFRLGEQQHAARWKTMYQSFCTPTSPAQ
jgi:hypothetical protein